MMDGNEFLARMTGVYEPEEMERILKRKRSDRRKELAIEALAWVTVLAVFVFLGLAVFG